MLYSIKYVVQHAFYDSCAKVFYYFCDYMKPAGQRFLIAVLRRAFHRKETNQTI